MRTHSSASTASAPASALAAAARRATLALDDLPDIITLDEVARVLRCSPWTIKHGLADGTFFPLPIKKRPYRWLKADLVAELASLKQAADARALVRRETVRARRRKTTSRRRS